MKNSFERSMVGRQGNVWILLPVIRPAYFCLSILLTWSIYFCPDRISH